jgi:surfactin family lipopeptide synthetase A
MLDHYLHLLEQAAMDPQRSVGSLPMLGVAEQRLTLQEFQNAAAPGPALTFVQRFEAQAAADENRIALICGDETLTYGALNRAANRLARRLLTLNMNREDLIVVYAKRGFGMIIGALAAMKAGGAFLPVDPSIPENRLRFLLEDSRAFAVVCADIRLPFQTTIPAIDVQDDQEDPASAHLNDNLDMAPDQGGLAYCIYTSGTTGHPKGVLVEHRSLSNLSDFLSGILGMTRNDIVLQYASCNFDAFIWELTQALTLGAALRLIPEEAVREPQLLRAALADCTAAAFPPQIASILKPEGLKLLVTAGNPSSPALVRQAASVNDVYVNGYGPSETTVNATWWTWEKGAGIPDRIPIGRPIPGALCYILNGMEPCGVGVPGEICIGGVCVARGYLNRPELTASKFIPNPFLDKERDAGTFSAAGIDGIPAQDRIPAHDERLFRTGDLGRWLPDGNIEFLGRVDAQIKIRGSRVEPAEVENVLRRCTGVKDAAVIVRKNENNEPVIYGYVAADKPLELTRLRAELDLELPDYMIPARLAQLDSIPYNISGKLDGGALPDIGLESEAYVRPSGREEILVARFFKEIMGADRVGARANFYSLGGDSIKAIRMVSRLREAGYDISVRQIMEQRTVERIAAVLEHSATGDADWGSAAGVIPLTPVQKDFFQANYPKPGHFNQSIALMTKEPVSEDFLRQALSALIDHHDILRAVYPNGVQTVPAPTATPAADLRIRDLRGKAIRTDVIRAENEQFQSECNLAAGPLFRVVLLRTDTGDHLIFCAHHLVVDGYSWRILLEDLVSAYRQAADGQEIVLPAKTAPFRVWSEALLEYAATEELQAEIPLWRNILTEAADWDIPRESDIAPEKKGLQREEIRVDSACVSSLLYEAGRAYQTEITDLLLSALSMAIGRWIGMENVVVELDNHGREELHIPVNVDRTVGWFTCTCPVLLPCMKTAGDAIPAVRETLRRIPKHGIGFGLLVDRLRTPETGTWHPRLCFNYLGQMDDMEMSTVLTMSPLPCGRDLSRDNTPPNEINISGSIIDGELIMNVDYDSAGWRPESMAEFRKAFETALAEIVSHCLAKDVTGEELGLSDDEADALNELFETMEKEA